MDHGGSGSFATRLLLAALLWPGPAGQAFAGPDLAGELSRAARRAVLEHTAWKADSLAVELAPLHLAGLPPDTVFELGETGGGNRGVIPVLARVDGRPVKRFSLGWRLRRFQRLPVTARELPRDAILTAEDLRIELCETTHLEPGDLVDSQTLIGQRLKRRTPEGGLVLDHDVKAVPLVQRNQLLTLWYRGDGVEVRLPARAQQGAGLGEFLPVRLEDSGRRLTARLIGPGLAVVEAQR
jgi:flagella basal body P-ring formation protein FlgA